MCARCVTRAAADARGVVCDQPQVPRVALTEMGPQLDCVLRRTRLPPVDLEKEALKQPKLTKKKVGCV